MYMYCRMITYFMIIVIVLCKLQGKIILKTSFTIHKLQQYQPLHTTNSELKEDLLAIS